MAKEKLAPLYIRGRGVLVRRPQEPLSSSVNLTVHKVKQLKKKKHAEPRFPANELEDVYATSDDDDFELAPGAKPSWVTKLATKVNKTFCLQTHIQKKLYEAHVNEKHARRREITMMKDLNMLVTSGSEKSITPEDKWICEHSTWTDGEATGHPAPTTSAAHDDIMEDNEESKDIDPDEIQESEDNY